VHELEKGTGADVADGSSFLGRPSTYLIFDGIELRDAPCTALVAMGERYASLSRRTCGGCGPCRELQGRNGFPIEPHNERNIVFPKSSAMVEDGVHSSTFQEGSSGDSSSIARVRSASATVISRAAASRFVTWTILASALELPLRRMRTDGLKPSCGLKRDGFIFLSRPPRMMRSCPGFLRK